MKIIITLFTLAFAASIFGQTTFDLKDASKYFDIKVKVAGCDGGFCEGKATFSFFKKGGTSPYQVIDLNNTSIQLLDDGQPSVNVSLLYDQQSVVNIDDFNFDGMEDVAICNGTNGSYNGPSYNIYLSSRAAGKFVYSRTFTNLASHLGMFTVDKKAKQLETFDKSGCCWHITERYSVTGGRPVKVFEEVEDATIQDETKVKITTKMLVKGRWKTSARFVPREE
jgi:hypothetical protein